MSVIATIYAGNPTPAITPLVIRDWIDRHHQNEVVLVGPGVQIVDVRTGVGRGLRAIEMVGGNGGRASEHNGACGGIF